MLSIRYLFFIFLLLASYFCHSAIVVKVRYNKCLIHLEGVDAQVGDYFQAVNLTGQAKGLVRLEKVKNGKSIAVIQEGIVEPNWILEKTNQRSLMPMPNVPEPPHRTLSSPAKQFSIGAMVAPNWTSIYIERRSDGGDDAYNGFGGSAFGFFNWDVNRFVRTRLEMGYSCIRATLSASTGNFRSRTVRRTTSNALCHMQWIDAKLMVAFFNSNSKSNIQTMGWHESFHSRFLLEYSGY